MAHLCLPVKKTVPLKRIRMLSCYMSMYVVRGKKMQLCELIMKAGDRKVVERKEGEFNH